MKLVRARAHFYITFKFRWLKYQKLRGYPIKMSEVANSTSTDRLWDKGASAQAMKISIYRYLRNATIFTGTSIARDVAA